METTGWFGPSVRRTVVVAETPESFAWQEAVRLWAQAPAALPLLDLQSVVWVDKRLQVQPSPLGLYLTTPGAAGWRWQP